MPALLETKGGKGPLDDARTETQTTKRQHRLGVAQISEHALLKTRQVVGGDDGKFIASGIQHLQRMSKTEAIRIQVGLHRRLMHPGSHGIVRKQQAVEFLIEQFG